MKNFVRSSAGKALLIILIIIFSGATVLSAIGIAAMWQLNLYDITETEILRSFSMQEMEANAFRYCDSVLFSGKKNGSSGMTGLEILVEKDSEIISRTTGFASSEADSIRMIAAVTKENTENEGNFVFFGVNEEGRYFSEKLYDVYDVTLKYDTRLVERSFELKLVQLLYSVRYSVYVILAACLIAALVLFAVLMSAAGKRPGDEDVYKCATTGLPFDVELILYLGFVGFFMGMLSEIRGIAVVVLLGTSAFAVCGVLGLLLSMDFAIKVKLHRLIPGMIMVRTAKLIRKSCCRLMSFGKTILVSLPIVWRTAVIVCALCVFDFVISGTMGAFAYSSGVYLLWWLFLRMLVGGAIIYASVILRRLQKAGQELADGHLDYKTNTEGLWWEFRKHAENLNAVSGMVLKAVAQATKSERMKAELITNVSHDIKTPLTSIINYATLVTQESEGNEKLKEHSEVLVRQSIKLKRLLEDLVDASRASNGALDICLTPCDAAVFITQAAGEYMDRISAAGLTLVTKVPEERIRIHADPRRMQRVFDNLLNNACKYSAPGTRVYLSLEKSGEMAVMTFRNTSREELNISPDELMERFVRGDKSRSTEGSGLGLSIARSLVELQGGCMKLDIDGDLFKVYLIFKVAE